MPLVPTILEQQLSTFMDDKSTGFISFPTTGLDAATYWANTIAAYTAAIIPPSTTAATAKTNMVLALGDLSISGAAVAAFPAAFTAFAVELAIGMAPAFVSTPPPTPLTFAPVFAAGMAGASAAIIITQMAGIIDVWFRTGLAAPNPPGTVFVPWS